MTRTPTSQGGGPDVNDAREAIAAVVGMLMASDDDWTDEDCADAILSALSAMPIASRLALARALVPGWAVGEISPPPEVSSRADGLSGTEYFKRCISGTGHVSAVHGKYAAAHPQTIRAVYEEAKTRFPAAADVIAALVFWQAIDRNRDEFLRPTAAEEPPHGP